MQTFKLTPKPQSDYRLEIKEIKYRCKLEKHGYRLDKVIYGFSQKLTNVAKLQAIGYDIEEIPFSDDQLNLANTLAERMRAKSKMDHLLHDQEFKQIDNAGDVEAQQIKLQSLNDKVQTLKAALAINGTVKLLKF